MVYWLDYSAAKLDGRTIRDAGYTGSIRYIDSPANLGRKHTNLDEYRSHLAAGLSVLLVMQTTTTASDGGYPVGQDHARRALAGANYLGYSGPIFFTNDRTTVPNAAAWRAYLDGAASILGGGRVGAYGFRNAMDLAVGHATYFWQAGRRSDVAAHTHIWQDNNTQVTVGGITCDRNLILKSIEEDDMPTVDEIMNAKIARQGSVLGGETSLKAVLAWFDSAVERATARDAAILAAVTAGRDITAEQLAESIDRAVAEHTPTAEQIATAIDIVQRPVIQEAVRVVLGEDNQDQADAIVDELVSRLANPTEGN